MHLSIIPDGCRRWALTNGNTLKEGYEVAFDHLYKVLIDWCIIEHNITHVSAFGLSTDNYYGRPKYIIELIFEGARKTIYRLLSDERVYSHKIKVKFIGERNLLPSDLKSLVRKVEQKTASYDEHFLFFYMLASGRWEIVTAFKNLLNESNSRVSLKEITENKIGSHLPSTDLPDIDVLIRTAEHRISNFMLWKIAYSEIYFVKKFFPDFSNEDLKTILKDFQMTGRRYGQLFEEDLLERKRPRANMISKYGQDTVRTQNLFQKELPE